MATKPQPASAGGPAIRYPAGQRLHCRNCGAEVEIISPCTCNPPELVLQCCGRDMVPSTGKDVHVGVE